MIDVASFDSEYIVCRVGDITVLNTPKPWPTRLLGKHGMLQHAQRQTGHSTVLANIANVERLNGRIRRNLMDTHLTVSFLMRSKLLNLEQMEGGAPDHAGH